MKSLLFFGALLIGSTTFASEVDSTGLEGDNLDLSAVLELFKESESPEDFEKLLNSENSNVNNLDLNEDGEVDYIRIIDTGDSISHVLTLQVPVNEYESQDVATIELEETDTDVVEIQIVGDEELYGENYILLPESTGRGPVVINVIMWRPVRFMWAPAYRPWVSPWRYRFYPGWYHPWKRRAWRSYHHHVVVYHGGCRRVYHRSFTHAHVHHYHRTHSVVFHNNHHHKHNGKTAGSSNGSGKTVKASAQSKTVSKAPATQSKSETNAGKPSTSKATVKANDKKATAPHQSAPQKKEATTQPSNTQKSSTTPSRKRPGTKTSTTRKRSGSSGKTSRGGRNSGGRKK